MAGNWAYKSGASGTVSVPAAAQVKKVTARGDEAATMQIDGGDFASVFPSFEEDVWGHLIGPIDIVFTGTDAYFVSWVAD